MRSGMFFWRGDRIPRHNVPYRPVFDPILVIFFALGLIRLIIAALRADSATAEAAPRFSAARAGHALYAARDNRCPKLSSLFVLIWIPVMLLPTILAEDSPHFLRAVGVLPMALIVPAIGLNTIGQWLAARGWRALSYVIIAAVLIVSGAWTVRDYSRYAVDAETAYAFEDAGVQLAQQARGDLQAGYRVYVAERFARDWTSVPFLIGGAYTSIPDGSTASHRCDSTGDAVLVAV